MAVSQQQGDVKFSGTKKYWDNVWETAGTGWKAFETNDHHRQVFRARLLGGSQEMLKLKAKLAVGTSKASDGSDIPPAPLGKQYTTTGGTFKPLLRILVPLCGDTPVLNYFISDALLEDFPEELAGVSLEVVGIDLAAKAFDSLLAEGEFASGSLADKKDINVEVAKTFTTQRQVGGATRKLTLVAGDFFAALESTTLADTGFDIVWDRASVVALPPSLRCRYTRVLETSLLHGKAHEEEARGPMPFPYRGIFLETVQRPEAIRFAGPPFHISPEAVVNVAEWPVNDGEGIEHKDLLSLRYRRLHASGDLTNKEDQAQQLAMVGGDSKKLPPFTFHNYVAVLRDY